MTVGWKDWAAIGVGLLVIGVYVYAGGLCITHATEDRAWLYFPGALLFFTAGPIANRIVFWLFAQLDRGES